jgi:peptidoglycan/xylan/chitin deacetylase (PgdA/CDA1 family)
MGLEIPFSEPIARFAAAVAHALGRGRIAILTYHRVLAQRDPLLPEEPDAKTFDWQVGVLARHFEPMTISQAMERLAAGDLPARAVCITFDDGYADNALVALPILQRWKVPATFFVATGFLNGGRMFNDTIIETVRRLPGETLDAAWLGLSSLPLGSPTERRTAFETVIEALKYRSTAERMEMAERLAATLPSALPTDLMMTSEQVRSLEVAGMAVGGHTRGHPILAKLEPGAAREEIESGRRDLEAILGGEVAVFAYPNGRPMRDYRPEHVAMVKNAGFRYAVSTLWGSVRKEADPYQLPRLAPLGQGPREFALRTARGYF